MDETLWHRCIPWWPILRGPDGRFFFRGEGQVWRRRVNGRWQYQQAPETEEELWERNVSGF